MPLTEVHLHGNLARFGGPFRLAIATPAEAVRALGQVDGFPEAIREGAYQVSTAGRRLDADGLRMTLGRARRIDIVPVAAGGKRDGVGKAILGTALMAAAWYAAPAVTMGGQAASLAAAEAGVSAGTAWGATAFTAAGMSVSYGNIAMLGASMVLGGVVQALTPLPGVGDFGQFEGVDQRPSFLFNGPVNTTEQGGPVPLIFGRARVGSRVVSAGLTAERI